MLIKRFTRAGALASMVLLIVAVECVAAADVAVDGAEVKPFTLQPHDSVVVLGNTFAERMHLFGYFETALHCRFPDHQLRVRKMGWSADEVQQQIRPQGFPELLGELRDHKADVLLLCFGMNESFGHPKQLEQFQSRLSEWVRTLQQQQFNGHAAPRIVLVSPIAHERLNGDLPDTTERNESLRRIVEAMAAVGQERKARYVDLFHPTLAWMRQHAERPLTFNGIHLTEYGDWVVSRMMAERLGWIDEVTTAGPSENGLIEPLRRAIYEKNYQYFDWWHPPNASYIHGRRRDTQGAKHLAAERQQQQLLIVEQERRIWAMPKPGLAQIWNQEPVEGRPIWFPTPADRTIPEAPDQPRRKVAWAIASDGDADTHIGTPQQQLDSFTLPDGYQVNLYASEVEFPIANPMAIQFDARGRLWVANTPTWPHSLPGKQPGDSIVILEDNDRDGVADQHHVFLDKLNLIHGFAICGDGAYVAQTPNLVRARDTDGDSRADWFNVELHGFGAEDAEHAMNNFCWSPGGALYFAQGIFYHTQVETPYGPSRVQDAAVFRYQPDEQRLGVYVSHALWNPYGTLFGRWGRGIMLDASAGQYYPMDVLSANFHYPKTKERTDHLSFAPGGSIAAGCQWLASRHFPEDVQGRFLVNHCEGDVGTHWYTLTPDGTLYKAQRHEPSLLSCSDKTFRPVAMAMGPDGAIYIADFYSHIFENVNFSKRHPGRDHSHGRIWRISYPDRPTLATPEVVGQPVSELLELLKVHEPMTREFARRELQQRGREAVVPQLQAWISKLPPDTPDYEHHLVEALWVGQGLLSVDVELLERLLVAKNPGARIAATQVLRFWQDRIDGSIELLEQQINDPDPRVRLHAVLACGFSQSPRRFEVALGAAEHAIDAGLEHALDETLSFLERLEKNQSHQ